MIAETLSIQVGRYTVQKRPRPDNPAWAVYIVFRGGRLIGKSFSLPNLDCCRWLELHQDGRYAEPSKRPRCYSYRGKNGHPKYPA